MRKYYILRFTQSDGLHKAGDVLANADNLLHIGQAEGSDVRLPNATQYEDTDWAVIEKEEGRDCWKLIRLSPYKEHDVRVNGAVIPYVHWLHDGDRIAFEGQRQELLFQVREDDLYSSTGLVYTPRYSRMKYLWVSLLAIFVLLLALISLYQMPMTDGMIDDARQSVFQIKVDSIQLVAIADHDTTVLSSCRTSIAGVAFLTTDSQLVTARHCIHPWLNIPDTLHLDTLTTELAYVRMALKAETHNQLSDDPARWEVISYCSIWRTPPSVDHCFSVRSTDFNVNFSRDLLIESGDYEHHYVWRSISARPRRLQGMLGDIAWLPVSSKMLQSPQGTIALATKEDLRKLCSRDGKALVILGTPSGMIEGHDVEASHDVLRRALPIGEDGYPRAVLSHNGEIVPGFSGGPVLMRRGLFGWCAVGVVSVTDNRNSNRCYSVPVSEIDRYAQKYADQ